MNINFTLFPSFCGNILDMLVNLESVRPQNRHAVTFTKAELKAVMAIYAFQVMNGSWRDYSIDFTKTMAVVSMYRSSNERPLVSVIKQPSNTATGFIFEVFYDQKRLSRTPFLDKALDDLKASISN